MKGIEYEKVAPDGTRLETKRFPEDVKFDRTGPDQWLKVERKDPISYDPDSEAPVMERRVLKTKIVYEQKKERLTDEQRSASIDPVRELAQALIDEGLIDPDRLMAQAFQGMVKR